MAELERKAGVPSGTLRNMGQGHMPSAEKVRKIASVLGITVDYIVNGDGEEDVLSDSITIIKQEPKKVSSPTVKEFATIIYSLDDQNMEALFDYARYLLSKQERD
jgi:transcriptional regulator with XRE-family HTH domain